MFLELMHNHLLLKTTQQYQFRFNIHSELYDFVWGCRWVYCSIEKSTTHTAVSYFSRDYCSLPLVSGEFTGPEECGYSSERFDGVNMAPNA